MQKQRQPNQSTPQNVHETELLSAAVFDRSQSMKEECTQTNDFLGQTIGSGDFNRPLYSRPTSEAEKIMFISENSNEFIVSHENDNNIRVRGDDDNGCYIDSSQPSNEMEIIAEDESGDDFHFTDDIHDENWQFSNAENE